MDVSDLARYLHLTPDQINRRLKKGDIPGRKFGGQWHFNEAEIHHWLEVQIGLVDPDEKDRIRRVLDAQDEASGEPTEFQLSALCPPDAVGVPLAGRSRSKVIRAMCDLAAGTGLLWDAAQMADAVAAREAIYPTVLQCGVALLHPRRPQPTMLGDTVLAMGLSPTPIAFADSGQLVDVYFLLCSYDDSIHLRTLAKISRLISNASFLPALRAAPDSLAAWEVLRDHEDELDDTLDRP